MSDIAQRYFAITPRIRSRLEREIFQQQARERGTSHLAVEERFGIVRTALSNLGANDHFESDVKLGQAIADLVAYSERAMETRSYSPQQRRLIQLARERLVAAYRAAARKLSAAEVRDFAEVGLAGRAHYAAGGYDPDQFLPRSTLTLAVMVAVNFAAYDATLNHDYFERSS